MAYDGVEIEMLALGDADCILVTEWIDDNAHFTLIDGGHRKDYPAVCAFLKKREVRTIQHLVSTHPDVDHINGLITLVERDEFVIQNAWVHDPSAHVDTQKTVEGLTKEASASPRAMHKVASLSAAASLLSALTARPKIGRHEPFVDGEREIGALTVCGPTRRYYEEQLRHFRDLSTFRADELAIRCEAVGVKLAHVGNQLSRKGSSVPSPENNSCVICKIGGLRRPALFTADAGVEALNEAILHGGITSCRWLQVPHHGSITNMCYELIETLCPHTAFISASGHNGHPHPEMIDQLHAYSTRVFSTHYPSPSDLWFQVVGTVPPRPEYNGMTPLPHGWNG